MSNSHPLHPFFVTFEPVAHQLLPVAVAMVLMRWLGPLGRRVGSSDHATALFCIECGRVLGFLYFDTFILHFEVELQTLRNVLLYIWL